jgi:hypothetical protein
MTITFGVLARIVSVQGCKLVFEAWRSSLQTCAPDVLASKVIVQARAPTSIASTSSLQPDKPRLQSRKVALRTSKLGLRGLRGEFRALHATETVMSASFKTRKRRVQGIHPRVTGSEASVDDSRPASRISRRHSRSWKAGLRPSSSVLSKIVARSQARRANPQTLSTIVQASVW